MPLYALQYYKQASLLRPSDYRMWTALGMCYGMVGEWELAIKAHKRALVAIEGEVSRRALFYFLGSREWA
jgi:anaphase-promoting complex subunit 8